MYAQRPHLRRFRMIHPSPSLLLVSFAADAFQSAEIFTFAISLSNHGRSFPPLSNASRNRILGAMHQYPQIIAIYLKSLANLRLCRPLPETRRAESVDPFRTVRRESLRTSSLRSRVTTPLFRIHARIRRHLCASSGIGGWRVEARSNSIITLMHTEWTYAPRRSG